MHQRPILKYIKQLKKTLFTTHNLAAFSGKSLSATTQALNNLTKNGVVLKIYRGVWSEVTTQPLSPLRVIPLLFPTGRVYVSFISALHLYGIVEQIPQVITLASTTHTRTIRTEIAVFVVHRIAPRFFNGFDWYKGSADFLIAEPEKALVDCLYVSAYKGKLFRHFPELHYPNNFSFQKVRYWIRKVPEHNIRVFIEKQLTKLKYFQPRNRRI